MMKRIVALSLCIAMVFSFVACTKTQKKKEAASVKESGQESAVIVRDFNHIVKDYRQNMPITSKRNGQIQIGNPGENSVIITEKID